jgi:NADH dehydrogenase [ubiquinone] 1 alpha subcomplex assembly factor 5
MNVFDRTAKRRQKNRAYASPDAQTYDYIRNEVASQIVDRVCDVARYFPLALDMGCGRSHIATATTSDVMGCLVQCDMAENALLSRSPSSPRVPVDGAVVDEEHCSLPFSDNTFDLIMSSLSLHWVNDLPGALKEAWRVLRPDSPLVGAMFAGDTLFELRSSLQLAEMEREGGFSPHVSPFVQVSDIGGLLNRAGFTITTIVTLLPLSLPPLSFSLSPSLLSSTL